MLLEYWSIGPESFLSVCIKVSQGFLCGRKQAALTLLSFVRASTVDSHTQTKGSNYLAITVCCTYIPICTCYYSTCRFCACGYCVGESGEQLTKL